MPPSGDVPDHWDVLPSPVASDGAQHWDVLPSPVEGEAQVAPGPGTYHPEAKDSPDPITVVGRPDTPGRRFRPLGRVAAIFVSMGVSVMAIMRFTTSSMAVVGFVVAALLLWLLVLTMRRRVWTKPRLSVNGEAFTVTDVEAVTRVVPWSEVGRLHLTVVVAADVEEVHLTWTSARGGADSTANLGNTLDLYDVRTAFESRVPADVQLQVGPRHAIGS